ncbi:response regulator transcription factor [Aquipuribacter nitratireducens]|uniref:LuxR family transcriptional regulator n=1 Tax=Aquipuribacter nitratireducens TaxID=650104 RepID=A0ABW0GHZ4_9MICO
MTGHLRDHDADRMLQLLGDVADDPDPGPAAPWTLLTGLQRLDPCDLEVSYQHHDYARQRTELIQAVDLDHGREAVGDAVGVEHVEDEWWLGWWTSACSWPQRSGDLRSVVHTYDVHPLERDRLAATSADDELRDCMIVSLPAEPGHARRICFMRQEGAASDERDREVLTRLRPHVVEIVQDAERRRTGVPRLTPREREVLVLVACGLSYPEVAARLVVSTATVRTHMEHVRERLGVSSAAAAVAVAKPHAPAQHSVP